MANVIYDGETSESISRDQIIALRLEARAAGDYEMDGTCEQALAGDPDSIRACERAIAEALARDESA